MNSSQRPPQREQLHHNSLNIRRPPLRYNDFGGTVAAPFGFRKYYEQRTKPSSSCRRKRAASLLTPTPRPPSPTPKWPMASSTMLFAPLGQQQWLSRVLPRLRHQHPLYLFESIAAAYVKDLFSKFPTPMLPSPTTSRQSLQDIPTLAISSTSAKTW